MDYEALKTEQNNEKSSRIDEMATLDMVRLINDEDKTVAFAVEKSLAELAKAVDLAAERLKNGGRLFYVGAGTSGRLGILDASELPPTYGTPYELVQGVIAGGESAAFRAAEGAEDDGDAMVRQLEERGFCGKDLCVGVSASGSTPCVAAALRFARSLGAGTIAVQCSENGEIKDIADVAVTAVTGPEVISGSTRMKAGTATKLILNTLTTCAMVRLGRVRGNKMAYMRPTNKKLADRAARIVAQETGKSHAECEAALKAVGGDIVAAIEALSSKG